MAALRHAALSARSSATSRAAFFDGIDFDLSGCIMPSTPSLLIGEIPGGNSGESRFARSAPHCIPQPVDVPRQEIVAPPLQQVDSEESASS